MSRVSVGRPSSQKFHGVFRRAVVLINVLLWQLPLGRRETIAECQAAITKAISFSSMLQRFKAIAKLQTDLKLQRFGRVGIFVDI